MQDCILLRSSKVPAYQIAQWHRLLARHERPLTAHFKPQMDSNSAQEPEIEEVLSDGLTLDLTNSHLPTLQDLPLPPTLTVMASAVLSSGSNHANCCPTLVCD